MTRCAACPIADGPCRAEADPRYGFLCRLAAEGEASGLASVRAASSEGWAPPPAPTAVPSEADPRPSIRLARLGLAIGRACLYRSEPDCSCQGLNRCWRIDPEKGADVGPLECLTCVGLWPPAEP